MGTLKYVLKINMARSRGTLCSLYEIHLPDNIIMERIDSSFMQSHSTVFIGRFNHNIITM